MKRLPLLVGIFALAAAPALAADLSKPVYKAPPLAAPAYNWNGFYVGAHIGWGWEHISSDVFNSVGAFDTSGSSNRDGIFGGGQIGYNWMFAPSWLLGIEADGSAADISGSSTGCTATGCSSNHGKITGFGTVRGRLGYAINNVLLYGTGGWAWASSETDRAVVCVVAGGGVCPGGPSPSLLTGMSAHASGTEGGWTAGGGVEWGFAPNWTAKIEYLHLQFDNFTRDYFYTGFPTAERRYVSNANVDTVRVGVNYLFNWHP